MDVIVDVGAKYDPPTGRFDHHHKEFDETFSPQHHTKLSSAGLVYKHFGREFLPILAEKTDLDAKDVELLYLKCYEKYIECIDAIDNGISAYPSDIKPKYRFGANITSIVDRLNPINDDENHQTQFEKAMELIGSDFQRMVYKLVHKWLPARQVVQSCLEKCHDYDQQGRIMVLHACIPWKEHVLDMENEIGVRVYFVLFQDTHNLNWMVQAVPASRESEFSIRLSLPEKWCGVRDDELDKISGIENCIFVHAGGFIGANRTFEGALEMAKTALDGMNISQN